MACLGDRRVACKVLVGLPDRKRPFGRLDQRLKDNIKINP